MLLLYYIVYMLGIFSRDKIIAQNLSYALFSFLIVFGALEVLASHVYLQEQKYNSSSTGFLCRAKRLSVVYSFLIFAAVGFPVSAMFTNNFLILSQLLSSHMQMGIIIIGSCIIASVALIMEMFRLKEDNKDCKLGKSEDLSFGQFMFMLFIVFMLLMSFIRPLWFVVDE